MTKQSCPSSIGSLQTVHCEIIAACEAATGCSSSGGDCERSAMLVRKQKAKIE